MEEFIDDVMAAVFVVGLIVLLYRFLPFEYATVVTICLMLATFTVAAGA